MYLIFCKKLQTVMLKKAAEIKKYEKKIKCIYAHDNVKCTETEGFSLKLNACHDLKTELQSCQR